MTLGHHEWPKSREPADAVFPDACDANGGWEGYLQQVAEAKYGTLPTRAQHYADNIARHYEITRFTPARPQTVAKPDRLLDGAYTLFFPFTDFPVRDWPVERWRDLLAAMQADGKQVVLGCGENGSKPPGEGQADRLRAAFGDFEVSTAVGLPAAAMLSLIAHAEMIIGNDSGMVHVAGLLGTPARVVASILNPEFVFGPTAPTVVGITADGHPQNFCSGMVAAGCTERCGSHGCPALASIPAERVLRSLL